jgi:TIR domain-containing protein
MIFLSYSWKDKKYVQKLASSLKDRNHEVWIDYENLNMNYPLEPQIENAIKRSTNILVVDTENSRKSKWVAFEIKNAKKHCKNIQIIYLDENHSNALLSQGNRVLNI